MTLKKTPLDSITLLEVTPTRDNELELQDQLRRSREEISEFAHIISHDLKAPLRAVTSLINWIQEDHGEVLNEDGKEQMRLLIQATTRLTRLFDGVLTYSAAGQLSSTPSLFDANGMLSQMRSNLPDKINLDFERLPELFGEKSKMERLFEELINNAVNALADRGGTISLAGGTEMDRTYFMVTDNGKGIDPKHHQAVFQIFRRGDAEESQEHIGLGLAVAKRIVEVHGGKIWISSPEGGGTAVHFELPNNAI
jgi:light-regulated signal transduction histidine kinase (bacteriophytochrome)